MTEFRVTLIIELRVTLVVRVISIVAVCRFTVRRCRYVDFPIDVSLYLVHTMSVTDRYQNAIDVQ